MAVRSSRRRRRQKWFIFDNLYLDPRTQYTTTIASAVIFAGLIFSGFLLFRYSDEEDLIRRGKDLMAEGKVAWATKTFQMLIEKYPESYEGHLRLGQAFLELGERRKAEQEFRIAAALKDNNGASSRSASDVDIAMSKLAIARKQFDEAERILTTALRKNPKETSLRAALFDLYEYWGDDLLETDKDEMKAIRAYERALRYVTDYEVEETLKEKLLDILQTQATAKVEAGDYNTAIKLLKKSIQLRYLPDTLVNIAEYYEKLNAPDMAITWYRKAFDANPSAISLKLYNLLMERGKALEKEKKLDEAKAYFEEAKAISSRASIPAHVMFPVLVNDVRFVALNLDEEEGEFTPQAKVVFANDSDRDLNFLAAKATFMSGSNELFSVTLPVATPSSVLGAKGKKNALKTITFKGSERLNLSQLQQGALRIRVEIAYNESDDTEWQPKAIHEVVVRKPKPPEPDAENGEAQGHDPMTPSNSGNSSSPPVPTPPVPVSPPPQ